ncbi:hypothetical protein HanHA89_Chr13g0502051 [Helianthus annuus]|nr:hypothetical protein HanHA89_Chr13g0502051 [Helianthus annuus]
MERKSDLTQKDLTQKHNSPRYWLYNFGMSPIRSTQMSRHLNGLM